VACVGRCDAGDVHAIPILNTECRAVETWRPDETCMSDERAVYPAILFFHAHISTMLLSMLRLIRHLAFEYRVTDW
jgi:hypothetical protein